MMLASVIIAAIAAATLTAVWYARQTVEIARSTQADARQAALDAASERRAAEADRQAAEVDRKQAAADRRAAAEDRRAEATDRKRRRLERIGELVEQVFALADEERMLERPPGTWKAPRNQLRQALVGLGNRLPGAADILNAATAGQAFSAGVQARNQVELELQQLDQDEPGV